MGSISEVHEPSATLTGSGSETVAVRQRVPRGVPGTVRRARRFVRRALESWRVAGQVVERAVLSASELVTNALKHGEGVIDLAVHRLPGTIRVTVMDGSTSPPLLRPSLPTGTGGRGMELIARSAARWGYEIGADGKVVWAEFTLVPVVP
jgi:anti-sigma regulatory factor (Ser/Thr protein kinase)